MKWITFGHEERQVQALPTPVTQKREDPAWSKALTAAVVLGGLVVATKSLSAPTKGGIEVTRVAF